MDPREEIKDIAPTLSQWQHEEGYTVPSGYFDQLSDAVLSRVHEGDKMDLYFNSLPDRVMNKIDQEENRSKENVSKVLPIRAFYKYAVAAALLIAVGTMVWTTTSDDITPDTYVMSVETEELNYILDNVSLDDFLTSDIIEDEVFEALLVSDVEYEEESIDALFYNISDDDILEEFL